MSAEPGVDSHDVGFVATDYDISNSAFWAKTARQRDEVFAVLRRENPVSRQRPPEGGFIESEDPYWAVVKHADIRYVSRHPEIFSSAKGVTFDDVPPEVAELVGAFLPLDAPRHTKLRGLVTHAFTPRHVRRMQEQIAAQAHRIVTDAVSMRDIEVVGDVAKRLPLWTISELMGVPEDERDNLYDAVDILVNTNDEEYVAKGDDALTALLGGITTVHGLAHRMQEARRSNPTDDLMTALMNAEVDGEALTPDEIASFLVLLGIAGNDTTRNTIAHGIKAFSEFPDQWDLLRSDPERYLDSAVEELIRWASPVIMFGRTVTADTVLNGQAIPKGERVILIYPSGNRDEEVFNEPWRFDITRRPNEHIGFGGGGPHFCLGAPIARTQLRAMFGEFVRSVAAFEAGEVDLITGRLIHNVRKLQCTLQLDGKG
ncbi:cytochrome P450 [Mycobacterium sp. NPDC003449]